MKSTPNPAFVIVLTVPPGAAAIKLLPEEHTRWLAVESEWLAVVRELTADAGGPSTL